MVLWKLNGYNLWNAFGFFGQGKAGKTALSFTFARLLVEKCGLLIKQGTSMKVIDDNFFLHQSKTWSQEPWGDPDKLGKRQQLITYLHRLGKSIEEDNPREGNELQIGDFMDWLLLPDPNRKGYEINLCHRDQFVNMLLSQNPCHSPTQEELNTQPQLQQSIRDSFDPLWQYALVAERNTRSQEDAELIEHMANSALEKRGSK
jgi:hypothetical protein